MTLNFLQYFQPKDRVFFPLFEKASANLVTISEALVELVHTDSEARRLELFREIEHLEHIGDEISHETFTELSANFITPFDREDIHALITALDDVVDYVHGTAKRIELYNVSVMTAPIIALADLNLLAGRELNSAIKELRNLKNIKRIKEATVRINSLENQADDVFDSALAALFDFETNAIEVIKMKDVLSALETATDKCEDAADVINSILVKHA